MAGAPKYSRAPLVEVVLDIRVIRTEPLSKDKLLQVGEREAGRYPQRAEQVALFTELMGGTDAPLAPSTRQEFAGFRFISANGTQLFHAQNDGFACNRLAPYGGWDQLSAEALRLWRIYADLTSPSGVSRLAVRYINRFDLRAGSELGDYFRTYPEVSHDLSQDLAGLVMRLDLPQADMVSRLVLQQTMLPPSGPDVTPIMLDLDHFKVVELPLDEALIWQALEQLHTRAVNAFEACITDRAREMIT